MIKLLSIAELKRHFKSIGFTDLEITNCIDIIIARRSKDRPIAYKKVKSKKRFV